MTPMVQVYVTNLQVHETKLGGSTIIIKVHQAHQYPYSWHHDNSENEYIFWQSQHFMQTCDCEKKVSFYINALTLTDILWRTFILMTTHMYASINPLILLSL